MIDVNLKWNAVINCLTAIHSLYLIIIKKRIIMNMNLVNEAFGLFIETLPLENMDATHPKFEELCEKECRIYTLFRQMNEEELDEYRNRIVEFNGDLV